MKSKSIHLNEEYAVRFPLRGTRGPINYAIRKCLAVDKRSNGKIVVSYETMVPIRPGRFQGIKLVQAQFVKRTLKWEPGRRLEVVGSGDFIAPWCDRNFDQVPDGRGARDGARCTVLAGTRYTEDSLGVPA